MNGRKEYRTGCGESVSFRADERLVAIESGDALRGLYGLYARGGHYFDPETLRWYGSRNFHLPGLGVSVETQTKAPSPDLRYRVTAWTAVWAADWDRPQVVPTGLCWHGSLRAARKCAKESARVLADTLGTVPPNELHLLRGAR